jgi:predicted HicB family RNase H-like nuclease
MKSVTAKKKSQSKILTGFRIHPEIKALATVAAVQENRSFSNYLENLIRKDIDAKNISVRKSMI